MRQYLKIVSIKKILREKVSLVYLRYSLDIDARAIKYE